MAQQECKDVEIPFGTAFSAMLVSTEVGQTEFENSAGMLGVSTESAKARSTDPAWSLRVSKSREGNRLQGLCM